MTPPAAPLGEHGDGIPLVSVVLATYNRAYVLEDTLRMVLAQTLGDFELIVCDDGSTDETPTVMAEWATRDPRIVYVRQARNLKTAGNVRHGIAMAKAELVAVLHDSDVYDPPCSNDGWPRSAPARRRRSSSTPTTSWTQTAGSKRPIESISIRACRDESFSNASTSGAGTLIRPSGGP